MYLFFFFKQKTAYDMRISDWSSDVCSSDLESRLDSPLTTAAIARRLEISVRTLELLFRQALDIGPGTHYLRLRLQAARRLLLDTQLSMQAVEIGSASWSGRVGTDV